MPSLGPTPLYNLSVICISLACFHVRSGCCQNSMLDSEVVICGWLYQVSAWILFSLLGLEFCMIWFKDWRVCNGNFSSVRLVRSGLGIVLSSEKLYCSLAEVFEMNKINNSLSSISCIYALIHIYIYLYVQQKQHSFILKLVTNIPLELKFLYHFAPEFQN